MQLAAVGHTVPWRSSHGKSCVWLHRSSLPSGRGRERGCENMLSPSELLPELLMSCEVHRDNSLGLCVNIFNGICDCMLGRLQQVPMLGMRGKLRMKDRMNHRSQYRNISKYTMKHMNKNCICASNSAPFTNFNPDLSGGRVR